MNLNVQHDCVCKCDCVPHLVLQARTEDEVIVGHLHTVGHQDKFRLPVDAHHLPGDHTDAGVQREPGKVSAAVRMTAGNREEDT